MRRSFIVISFFISLILVTGGVLILVHRNQVKCFLYNFSIIEVMALLTSIVIGFGLTYLISVSLAKESKKNEVATEILSAIKDDFAFIMQQLVKNLNRNINDNIRSYFLLLSKNTDKDLSILNEIYEKNSYLKNTSLKELLKLRSDFNYILTGDNLISGITISEKFVEECSEKYYLVKQAIFRCRFEINNI